MSLNQLTANYTDSENEGSEDGSLSPQVSKSASPTKSAQNTPKKLNLVSYEHDEEEDKSMLKEDLSETSEDMNSEPMDTGTDEEKEDNCSDRDLGIKLPPAPPGRCSKQLQDEVAEYVRKTVNCGMDYNKMIQNKKEFRNPSIYEKLISHLGLDELGSNYPLDRFDPHCWGKESFYDELAKAQKEEMDRREKERKEKTKVDIISGTKKTQSASDEEKKRKSRFDVMAPNVKPGQTTSAPTSTKTTISAYGGLKLGK